MAKKRSSEGVPQESTMAMTHEPNSSLKSAQVLKPTSTDVFPSLEGRAMPTTTVNTSNLGEVKLALDEAVKKIVSKDHQFTEIHTYTDIRLVLGWTSVLIAAATMGYSYHYGFESTKGITMLGVFSYMVLEVIQAAYVYYVLGRKIYVGKRKSLSKRIETETIQVTSTTTKSKSSSSTYTPPKYSLTISYRRSTNANKSLLRLSSESSVLDLGQVVDEAGGVEDERIKDWIAGVLGKVIGTPGEEDDAKRR